MDIHILIKISNCLGVDLFKSVLSHKLKDKQLPNRFYRNYYQKNIDEDFEYLFQNNLAEKQLISNLNYYSLTQKGIDLFITEFEKIVIYEPLKNRKLKYLKNRINFYCKWARYNFCKDNSEHIIEYFKKYYIHNEYVSHTTKDCIEYFKPELKKCLKKGLI